MVGGIVSYIRKGLDDHDFPAKYDMLNKYPILDT
jgi:hypothetical protein